MNIGRLDRKIVIETPTNTTNTMGEAVSSWATYHTCFASVQKAGGSETNQAGKITAENRIKFKIRFFAGITERMRISYNSNNYDITEIQELGREGLWITATKQY